MDYDPYTVNKALFVLNGYLKYISQFNVSVKSFPGIGYMKLKDES